MIAFQIPQYDQDPSDAMIDWLATCPCEWNGDDSGITMEVAPGVIQQGSPGDWVVQRTAGWGIVDAEVFKILWRAI